ncbi:MAG TPA: ATP-binding protein [Gemmatimonadaceae bacterium]|nr:ATP-binding protein [Gemmatimonadaceae bacterium]
MRPDHDRRTPLLGRSGWLARYAAAVLASAIAIALTVLSKGYTGGRDFTFSYAAVAISGALGLGPGITATVLCVVGVNYFLLHSPFGPPSEFLALGIFFLVALLISGLASRLRGMRMVAEEKQHEAEQLTEALRQQASELERRTQELDHRARELERAEAFNRVIVEGIGEPMVVHDPDWRFRYINEPAMRMFATSRHPLPHTLLGERLWDHYPDIVDHPFGINLRRAMTERIPVTFEAYYPERGEWSDLRCYPLPDGGLLTVWKNVTERRHAEEAQRYLSEASAMLGKSLDYEETLNALARLAVPALADWCRIDMLDEEGTPKLIAVSHADPEKVKWARQLAERYPPNMNESTGLPAVLRSGVAEIYPEITEEMLTQGTRDPEYLKLLKTVQLRGAIIAPLTSVRGVLGAITLVSAESRRKYNSRDLDLAVEIGRRAGMAVENARVLSAEKMARAAAVEARAAAEEANAAKSQFLAFMSHELRTPLNAIAGYVDLILAGIHGPVSAAQREALDRVRRSQRVLLGLINNILNFVRLDAGHVELNLSETPASEIVKDVEPLVTPQLQAKGLEYRFSCDADAIVHADVEKTQQILLNLLSNAIKFTEPGGSVALTCAARDGVVTFSVKDTGCGIPPDKSSAVFEPFVQLDRTLRSGHQGVGLGLAISRELAVQMNGSLTLESPPEQGCNFVLTLPRSVG